MIKSRQHTTYFKQSKRTLRAISIFKEIEFTMSAALQQQYSATYEDVKALPPNVVGELIDGELHTMPRPRLRHAEVLSEFLYELKGPYQRGLRGPGGWWILPEPELHLIVNRRTVVLDLAGWRKERMPTLLDVAQVTLTPDWVCEILSDSTEVFDRAEKMPLYAEHGVPYAWLVDVDDHRLEAYWNDAGTWRPLGQWRHQDQASIPPFDAIPLHLVRIWPE